MINIGIDLVSSHNLLFGDGMLEKHTLSYTDFSFAGSSNSIVLTSLPPKRVLLGVLVKHSAAFTGGGISVYTLSVGITGAVARYASAWSVVTAPSSSYGQLSSGMWCEDFVNATPVRVQADCQGAALSAATQGSVDITLYTIDMP